MKSQMLHRLLMLGLMLSVFCSSLALAEDRGRSVRAPAQPAARSQTTRKGVAFKTDRTDSWLCNHVSPFFCSDLFPTLTPSPDQSSSSTTYKVPDRSRH